MKLSTAMMEGFAKVGRQCKGDFYKGANPRKPLAVCALGAAHLALHGRADILGSGSTYRSQRRFDEEYRGTIATFNDKGTSIPDIIGMLKAIGE